MLSNSSGLVTEVVPEDAVPVGSPFGAQLVPSLKLVLRFCGFQVEFWARAGKVVSDIVRIAVPNSDARLTAKALRSMSAGAATPNRRSVPFDACRAGALRRPNCAPECDNNPGKRPQKPPAVETSECSGREAERTWTLIRDAGEI
jgi:hypothetical protein